MQRRQQNQGRRGTKQRRQLARTRNGLAQNSAGASHRDNVPQLHKFNIFDEVEFSNATSDFSIGLKAFNVIGSSSPFQDIIKEKSSTYEQYRIRRARIRAQVGRGYDNDLRLKTILGCRVDVDNQLFTPTIQNVQSLIFSENSVLRTFTERGNVLMADYRPIQRANISNLSESVLPSSLQWYPTNDVALHTWKGAVLAALVPETVAVNSLKITIWIELDVEFRGRITDASSFSLNRISQEPIVNISPALKSNLSMDQMLAISKILDGVQDMTDLGPTDDSASEEKEL